MLTKETHYFSQLIGNAPLNNNISQGCAPSLVGEGAPTIMSVRRVEYPPPEEPRMSKEMAMVQWMDAMLDLQKAQVGYTFMVAQAVAKLDKSKELLPFSHARQHFEVLRDQITRADALADQWRFGR